MSCSGSLPFVHDKVWTPGVVVDGKASEVYLRNCPGHDASIPRCLVPGVWACMHAAGQWDIQTVDTFLIVGCARICPKDRMIATEIT